MRYRRVIAAIAVVVGLSVVAAAPASAPASNLLQNSSFEERSGPAKEGEPWAKGYLDGVARSPFAHWGYSGFWDGGDYDVKLGRGRTGRLCARLVCREKGRGGVCTEAIRVPVGTKLQFKGWFKAIGAKGGKCQVNFEGDPGDGWASIDLPAKSDYDWTEVVGTVTVPKPKTIDSDKVDIHVFIYIRTYGELWIDDVTLAPVDTVTVHTGDGRGVAPKETFTDSNKRDTNTLMGTFYLNPCGRQVDTIDFMYGTNSKGIGGWRLLPCCEPLPTRGKTCFTTPKTSSPFSM